MFPSHDRIELDSIYWNSGWRDYWRAYIKLTHTIVLNGEKKVSEETINFASSFFEPPTYGPITPNWALVSNGTAMALDGICWGSVEPDIDALEIAIARNFADYQIPGYCPTN